MEEDAVSLTSVIPVEMLQSDLSSLLQDVKEQHIIACSKDGRVIRLVYFFD